MCIRGWGRPPRIGKPDLSAIEDHEKPRGNVSVRRSREVTPEDEAARRKAEELNRAIGAGLNCTAESEQSRALVETLYRMVTQHETQGSKRKNQRYKKADALRSAIAGFMADLVRAERCREKSHGLVYRTMRREAYTGQRVSFRSFKSLVDALEGLGMLEVYPGYLEFFTSGGRVERSFGPGKATRYRGTPALLKIITDHGIAPADFRQHFLAALPENPLQLRTRAEWAYRRKESGKPMRFDTIDKTVALEAEVRSLNQFLDGFEVSGGVHRGYVRIFNNGDEPGFDWNRGGRLYSVGEDSYQHLSKAERLAMRIDGEPVCEIDIRASYLTILHAWCGERFDARKDPYVVPGLGSDSRELAKAFVTASFGMGEPITKWPKRFVEQYREETGRSIPKSLSATRVGERLLAAHPVLKRLGERVGGRKLRWAEVMYAESQAILRTMLGLMEVGVPSLAVFDSIIVPVSQHHLAMGKLGWEYRKGNDAELAVLVAHSLQDHPIAPLPSTPPGLNLIKAVP